MSLFDQLSALSGAQMLWLAAAVVAFVVLAVGLARSDIARRMARRRASQARAADRASLARLVVLSADPDPETRDDLTARGVPWVVVASDTPPDAAAAKIAAVLDRPKLD